MKYGKLKIGLMGGQRKGEERESELLVINNTQHKERCIEFGCTQPGRLLGVRKPTRGEIDKAI